MYIHCALIKANIFNNKLDIYINIIISKYIYVLNKINTL